ncbi:hypothetical protein PG991_008594 [Apiospora marii]|uniref:YMC020W-like alpha/beta hydrolase domain-containing protein n=1 Tax=Apiospora marii TaxID=335849 RepID=A0ABR1RL54_9PEZI
MGGTQKGVMADWSRYDTKKSPETPRDSDTESIKTLPRIAESKSQPNGHDTKKLATGSTATTTTPAEGGIDTSAEVPTQESHDGAPGPSIPPTVPVSLEQPARSSGWLEWLSRSTATQENAHADIGQANEPSAETQTSATVAQQEAPMPVHVEVSQPVSATPNQSRPTNSWFGWWGASTAPSDEANGPSPVQPEAHSRKEDDIATTTAEPPTSTGRVASPATGSTWAFFYRYSGSKVDGETTATQEQGDLAVVGDESVSSPQRSVIVDAGDPKKPKEQPLKRGPKDTQTKSHKRIRSEATGINEIGPARPETPINKATPAKPGTPTSVKSVALPTPNLLLPSFRNTYQMQQNPSILKQITQLLLRAQQPPPRHVYLVKEPPRIKKAVAIGVHGLVPTSWTRAVIGAPTGTSLKFANHGAEAIRRWANTHGCADCEIENVALNYEGKIGDRVDKLWLVLLNWIEHIRNADLILLACHSQGVPVGVMLVAKLLELGVIPTARIGICAMAGVCLGPFPEWRTGVEWIMGSAAELWEFGNPESEISKRFEQSLRTVLERGTRITYIGSIDDQVVPMESAVYSPASHPYIYRAVFVDGQLHAPNFITHLVGFALKLRNLGISDQGLIRELSGALAGSLYTGEGHSRLYDDESVYDLSVSHALETTVVKNVSCDIPKHSGLINPKPNPYVLPWAMRGLLEEDIVKTELSAETADLLKQFDDWQPATKPLQDIKTRLEVVRSKL